MSDNPQTSDRPSVVVLLGTGWARLADHNTRWRAVLQCWAQDARIGSVSVVDFPSLSLRNATKPLAEPIDTWDADVAAFAGRVVVARHATPLDPLAWRATGHAISRVVPGNPAGRVVIAATPLWAPVLRFVAAARTGFDAVDDWRAFPPVARIATHVAAGYRAAARAEGATAVSEALAGRLLVDFGVRSVAVPNGVDLSHYAHPPTGPPPGIPNKPFAVYVGVVQERVDVELLAAVARSLPVVVAGPVAPSMQDALAAASVHALGPVPSATIPALLQSAAVGLIPHRVDALTTSMDPMKLREYLAAGLPVVTTIAPTADIHSGRVLVAREPATFASSVERAAQMPTLEGPDPDVIHRTWSEVADALYEAHVAPSASPRTRG